MDNYVARVLGTVAGLILVIGAVVTSHTTASDLQANNSGPAVITPENPLQTPVSPR